MSHPVWLSFFHGLWNHSYRTGDPDFIPKKTPQKINMEPKNEPKKWPNWKGESSWTNPQTKPNQPGCFLMLHENGTRQKKNNPLGIPGSVRTVASSVPGLNPEETSQPQLGWAPPLLSTWENWRDGNKKPFISRLN